MSDSVRDLVEDPKAHPDVHTATNLPDAADSEASLEGYAAVNGLDETSDIARLAYQLFEQRGRDGQPGSADQDWFRAEAEVRRLRYDPGT